jgi:CBS domain containing-hemolysin-like protein
MNLIFAFLIVFIQGFFAGSETAFITANRIRLKSWADLGNQRAQQVLQLLDRKEELIIGTLLGTNLAVVAAATLFTDYFITQIGPTATLLAILVNVTASLVLGEFLPKTLAQARPEFATLKVAPVIRAVVWVFSPVISAFKLITQWNRLVMVRENPHRLAGRRDFLAAVREAERLGHLPDRSSGIVKNLFDFTEARIRDVMTPLSKVVAMPKEASLKDLISTFTKYGYSRYPVYEGVKKNFVGLVYLRDLIFKRQVVIRPAFFVAEDRSPMEILKAMQRRGEHIAVVVGRDRVPIGIATLEDLLEELVGEIRSEE